MSTNGAVVAENGSIEVGSMDFGPWKAQLNFTPNMGKKFSGILKIAGHEILDFRGHHPQISIGSNFFRRRRSIAKVYIFEKLRIFSFDWCYFQSDSGTF
jgi:hypothetical protein